MITPITPTSFSITRAFDAPREEVFAAWTTKALLEQWMCRDVPSHRAEYTLLDVRDGGRYVIEIKLPEGGMHRGSGVFREVKPPEKLVFTWFWETIPASGGPAIAESRESVITLELTPRGPATELVLTHDLIETEEARRDSELGWSGCLDVLETVLAPA